MTSKRRGQKANSRNISHGSPGGTLATIEEAAFAQPCPSIATVERVAATKIYLETHFEQLLAAGPSPRQIRQQLFEIQLFNRNRAGGVTLSTAEIQAERSLLHRLESEHLRELRVIKTKSWRALRATHSADKPCLADEYETIKILGKGSFGVVKLVRDRARRQVYAMKVIKKSNTLRTSQEGHLRAERDFLVASEGSKW
jgi:hypothetical protein